MPWATVTRGKEMTSPMVCSVFGLDRTPNMCRTASAQVASASLDIEGLLADHELLHGAPSTFKRLLKSLNFCHSPLTSVKHVCRRRLRPVDRHRGVAPTTELAHGDAGQPSAGAAGTGTTYALPRTSINSVPIRSMTGRSSWPVAVVVSERMRRVVRIRRWFSFGGGVNRL